MASFSKENLIVVYRQNDADSYYYANEYKRIYSLDADQLVAIPCSNTEILTNYSTFATEVETPIKNAISSSPLTSRSVFAILLMPFVPGGFYDGDYTISATSRLSRMNDAYSRNTKNALYDRQIFKRFNEENIGNFYICTRIDGPALVVKKWLQNIENAKFRSLVNGSFYIDPYSAYSVTGSEKYTQDLESFSTTYLKRLGLEIKKTRQIRASKDALFPSVKNDSFFWGWGADRGSDSFFKTTDHLRAFFYNADFDGASQMRITATRTWPLLAIRAGFVATGASLKSPDAVEFLRPQPFMDALFRGATMGEAFLFSQPVLDSSMCCFGDPLLIIQFPVAFVSDTRYSINKSFVQMEDYYAKAVMSDYRRSRKIDYLRNMVATGSDPQVQLDILYPINDFYNQHGGDSYKNDFALLTRDFFNYAQNINRKAYDKLFLQLNDYLTYTGNKISNIILATSSDGNLQSSVDSANIIPSGYWDFADTIDHYSGDFRFYNFELQVVKSFEDFEYNQIILEKSTLDSNENWYFENIDGNFDALVGNGIGSNFAGKKIKYVAKTSEYLSRGEYYWARIRQIDESQNFDWRYFEFLVYH